MSTTLLAPPPSVTPATRRQLLQSTLARLHKLTLLHPAANSSQTIACGAYNVRISPWEWSALIQAFKGGDSGANYSPLLAESVALQVHAFETLQRLPQPAPPLTDAEGEPVAAEAAEPVETPVVPEELVVSLVLDLACGIAICDDLSEAIDGLRKAGSAERADQVAQFLTRMRSNLDKVREAIGEDNSATAEGLAKQLPRQLGPLLAQVSAESEGAPREARSKQQPKTRWQKMSPKARDRMLLAGIGAIVALVVATTLFVLPNINRKTLPTITAADFTGIPQIEQVIARAPNLYVRVSPQRWQEMGDSERQALVAKVVQQTDAAGYAAAHINTSAGKPLARWMRKTGTQIF